MPTSSTFSTDNQYIKYRIVTTENSYSIPNNTSSVNVKVQAWRTNTGYTTYGNGTCYCTINGTKYSQKIDTNDKISYKSYTTLFNKTVTIPHNADGSKTVGISAYIKHDRFDSSSHGYNVALTRIPRQANITSAPVFNDEENPTIEYNNLAGDIVTSIEACISLDGETDTIPYRSIALDGTSYTFELTEAQRNTLRAACPNSNTLEVYFILKTELYGAIYYSTVETQMTIVNANPIVEGVSYSDENPDTYAITGNRQEIISGHSIVNIIFRTVARQKYAVLTAIDITINGVSCHEDLNAQQLGNWYVEFGVVNSSTNVTAAVVVTDSRGNTTALSIPLTMLAWSYPTAIVSCARKNNFYEETDLNVDASISSLNNKNSLTIEYQYKETDTAQWSNPVQIQDNVPVVVNLAPNTKDFNVKVIVSDRIGSTTYNLVVYRGTPLVFFDRLKNSVSINAIPANDGAFEIDGEIVASGDISAGGNIVGANIGTAGDIEALGDLTCDHINCNSMSYEEITDQYTITKTSGNFNIYEFRAYRSGNVVHWKIILNGNGSAVSAGSNGWVGTIAGGPRPVDAVRFLGFTSGTIQAGALDNQTAVTIRNLIASATLSSASRTPMSCCFITID